MGQKLASFFTKAHQIGGLRAHIRLSVLTKMSWKAASNAPDVPEIIKRFQIAYKRIESEYK
ncbi:MAG: hypothetical protein AB1454_04640 [Candidatus Auribacterota bacterium]|jgi:hypothetical protein|uniref:Hpt domain-containing protein n=1 Tax=Candidatus Auribacter fodinae TaxID=2093366 RepID=A0A3A4R817_9BACT|nr:MAG: hypothetical protein C4541_02720 [Candidatus Auribacter fodinae]